MKDTFLRNTAVDIVRHYGWEGLRNLTLVFPSHRAGLVLKNALKQLQVAEHPAPVFLPKITTLSELFDALSPLQQEDELRLVCRLYRIYCSVTGESLSLDLFYGWGRQLISDFNNIDKAVPIAEIKAFFANTVSARELESVQLSEEVSARLKDLLRRNGAQDIANEQSLRRKYDILWRNLYTIYLRFNEELRAEGRGYEGARMQATLSRLTDEAEVDTGSSQFCFIGFNYLLRVEKELMRWFKEHRAGRFYWDYVADFPTNSKAFAFIAQHRSDLGDSSEPLSWDEAKEVDLISTTTANAQAQYVSPWLQAHYMQRGEQTGIVICDERMLEPVIYALPSLQTDDVPVPINITKGFPMANTRVYAQVMESLHKEEQVGQADLQGVLDRVLQLLSHEGDAADTEAASESRSVSDWHSLLLRESVYQMRCVINRFKQLLDDPLLRGAIDSVPLLRSLLHHHLSGISLPFNGEPITDIQVMGVLETRMLDFDNLLILNVEEGIVPRQQADISFIPYYLRKAYHMPTREEGATVYAYNFFRLMARAQHVTILFSESETAMGRKSMSRFVMQMQVNPAQFRVHKFTLTETMGTASDEDHADKLAGNERQGVPIRSLSPSAIATYIACPRKFYWQYVERLQAPEPDRMIFASNTLGTFVHQVMLDLYEGRKALDADWLAEVEKDDALLESTLRRAYDEVNEKENTSYLPDNHRMENTVIIGFVRNILRRDQHDARTYGLEIVLTEQKRYFEIDGVRIGGIIDRLDRVGNTTRVVDYKTGTYTPKRLTTTWDELLQSHDAHYVLQTLIYAESVFTGERMKAEALAPHLFFTQRDLCKAETCVRIDGEPIDNYAQVREQFLPLLTEKVREIVHARAFPMCPEGNKCCSYCPFLTLCGRKTDNPY